jgi:hypothetical protein
VLVAARLDHRADRRDGDRGAGAEARRREPAAQAALVGKPFERVADAGAVHRAAGDAGDRAAEIEHAERGGDRVDVPGHEGADAAGEYHPARADVIDDPALERHQPGLQQDEDRECDLDLGLAPSPVLLDRQHEQRPAVLQVGHARHADDAENELQPTIG